MRTVLGGLVRSRYALSLSLAQRAEIVCGRRGGATLEPVSLPPPPALSNIYHNTSFE